MNSQMWNPYHHQTNSPLNSSGSSSTSSSSSAASPIENSSKTTPLSIASLIPTPPSNSYDQESAQQLVQNEDNNSNLDLPTKSTDQTQSLNPNQLNSDSSSVSTNSSPTTYRSSPLNSSASYYNQYANFYQNTNFYNHQNSTVNPNTAYQNYHQYFPALDLSTHYNNNTSNTNVDSYNSNTRFSNSSNSSLSKQESEDLNKVTPPPASSPTSINSNAVYYNNMNLSAAQTTPAAAFNSYYQHHHHQQSVAQHFPAPFLAHHSNPYYSSEINAQQTKQSELTIVKAHDASSSSAIAYQERPAQIQPKVKPAPSTTTTSTMNPKNLNIKVKLQDMHLWKQFNQIGTEMIITKSGRRMFPSLRVSVSGLESQSIYQMAIDIIPVDENRYKYHNGEWVVSGKGESPFGNPGYLHSDGDMKGSQWCKQIISFHKLKLTNNPFDKAGHIVLNSMQKYVPRLHVIQDGKLIESVIFHECVFMAVTAYQNEAITKLKIEHNPFAKGFRDGQHRKDYRNQHMGNNRISIEDGNEDGENNDDFSQSNEDTRLSSAKMAKNVDSALQIKDMNNMALNQQQQQQFQQFNQFNSMMMMNQGQHLYNHNHHYYSNVNKLAATPNELEAASLLFNY
jgi:hypothetical protein